MQMVHARGLTKWSKIEAKKWLLFCKLSAAAAISQVRPIRNRIQFVQKQQLEDAGSGAALESLACPLAAQLSEKQRRFAKVILCYHGILYLVCTYCRQGLVTHFRGNMSEKENLLSVNICAW